MMAVLAVISFLAGVGMLWVFSRTSNQAAIKQTKNRLRAYLYELRLFPDEPGLLWTAQRRLLTGNAKYIGLTLRPVVVLALPFIILMSLMEPYFGKKPLAPGESALVTVQMKAPVDGQAPVLEAPAGIVVETPAVRSVTDKQVSWRIRAEREVSGVLKVNAGGEQVEKRVVAGSGDGYESDRRSGNVVDMLFHMGEAPLRSGAVEWVEVTYPEREITFLGIELHWIVWFLVISMIAALLVKGRMGVTF